MVVLALCVPADAASPSGKDGEKARKLDDALLQKGNSGSSKDRQPVIITLKRGAKPGVRKRLEASGGRVINDHGIVNALSVHVDARALDALIDDPAVERISTDAPVSALGGNHSDPVVSDLQKTLAIGNWFGTSSVTIAVIDSGIAATTDFTGRIVGTFDFTYGQGGVARTPVDEFGHGTHVAGLAGSSGATSNGRTPASRRASGCCRCACSTRKASVEPATSSRRSSSPSPTGRCTTFRSSTCRLAIRSTSRPPPIRWCVRSKPRSAPASSS
jgi:subtilisin family serine protease